MSKGMSLRALFSVCFVSVALISAAGAARVPADYFDGFQPQSVQHMQIMVLDEYFDASAKEIRAVFERLELEDWLDELAEGINTPVGERGSALSVGERQLVTVVRAAIADPDLLILDEATSAVDPATEVRLSRALTRLTRDRTVVTIAHRLSTAEAADRVLVFDGGRIVQDGSHDQLIAEGKSKMTKDNYHRFPDDEKVIGVDYQFYRDLLAGKYDDEINRGLTDGEREKATAGMEAMTKA